MAFIQGQHLLEGGKRSISVWIAVRGQRLAKFARATLSVAPMPSTRRFMLYFGASSCSPSQVGSNDIWSAIFLRAASVSVDIFLFTSSFADSSFWRSWRFGGGDDDGDGVFERATNGRQHSAWSCACRPVSLAGPEIDTSR